MAMKDNQLALSPSYGLLRIDKIVSDYCVYSTILTGKLFGYVVVEYKSTIQPIPNTENLKVFGS